MIYLVAMFVSPLYFLLRSRWLSLLANSVLYGLALLLAVSIVGLPFAIPFWMLSAVHAMWHLRKEVVAEHATILAEKMAEKMGALSGRTSNDQ